jgi:hypothetical protein
MAEFTHSSPAFVLGDRVSRNLRRGAAREFGLLEVALLEAPSSTGTNSPNKCLKAFLHCTMMFLNADRMPV